MVLSHSAVQGLQRCPRRVNAQDSTAVSSAGVRDATATGRPYPRDSIYLTSSSELQEHVRCSRRFCCHGSNIKCRQGARMQGSAYLQAFGSGIVANHDIGKHGFVQLADAEDGTSQSNHELLRRLGGLHAAHKALHAGQGRLHGSIAASLTRLALGSVSQPTQRRSHIDLPCASTTQCHCCAYLGTV